MRYFKFMVLFVLLYIPTGTLCILGASYMFTTVGELSGYCNIPIIIINFMFVNWLLGA